jgi:hypothetical protein
MGLSHKMVRIRAQRRQRKEMEELGISEEDIGLSLKEFNYFERSRIIQAIQKGEIGTGIDEIRKKIGEIKAQEKEREKEK